MMASIAEKKKELRENSERFRIGIFQEVGFPVQGIPKGLTPEWLKEVLENENFVVFLNELEIRTYSLVRPELLDLIILPYGGLSSDGLPDIEKISAGWRLSAYHREQAVLEAHKEGEWPVES